MLTPESAQELISKQEPPKPREPEKKLETDEEDSESDEGEDAVYQPAAYRKKSRKPPSSSSKPRTRPRRNTGEKNKLNNPNILKDNSSEISITKGKILQQQLQKYTLHCHLQRRSNSRS